MLTLERRQGQSIVLTAPGRSPIIISVVETHSGRCKVGVTAPPDVRILRDELAEPSVALDEAMAAMYLRAGRRRR